MTLISVRDHLALSEPEALATVFAHRRLRFRLGRTYRFCRSGFTVLEVVLALGILVTALVTVAQVAAWSLGERARITDRQEAVELAANILETARALPWENVTPEWAATQKLPANLAERLFQGRLSVRVEPEAARDRTKRVTVAIRWKDGESVPVRPVELVGLFSARTAAAPEGKP